MDEDTARFVRDNLDSRAKLDVALFLHSNRFTLESAVGLARRIGRTEEDLAPELGELANAHIVTVHGDVNGPRPCLFGYTEDGLHARHLQRVAEAWQGPDRSALLACVLDGQARRHNMRLRELRRLDSLKTQFLSMVSHELRSPLTAIRGYVEILQANPDLDDAQRDLFFNTVLTQCDRLSTTVNNMLMAADMHGGEGWQGQCRPVCLRELLPRLVHETKEAEPRRRFEVEMPSGTPDVRADEGGVALVLRNLLENAVKFSLDDTTIGVRVETDGEKVLVHVADEGVGISPDRLRTIFDRFYQAEYYRTRRAGGAGLGLYLVKEIMEGMGGSITVSSEFGKGSVFTCAFAAAPADEPDTLEVVAPAAGRPTSRGAMR